MKAKTDAELRGDDRRVQASVDNGATLDDILPEAFAVVPRGRPARAGMRHYDVQLIGGMVLHRGGIAEMRPAKARRSSRRCPST